MLKSTTSAVVHVPRSELPVVCPLEGSKWNMHPRVYLPVAKDESEVHCPYCGTKYVIVDAPGEGGNNSKDGLS